MKCPFATWVPAAPENFSADKITHDFAVIHVAQGTNQGGIDAWFHNPHAVVSAHFSISKLGVIHQHVDTDQMAYHCAEWNGKAIGIEHLGLSGQHLTVFQRRSLKRLLLWINKAHGTRLVFTNDPHDPKGGVIGHGKIPEGTLSHPNCPGWPILSDVSSMLRRLIPRNPVANPVPVAQPTQGYQRPA